VVSFTIQSLYPGDRTPGGWVGPRIGLEAVEKRNLSEGEIKRKNKEMKKDKQAKRHWRINKC
jgi:hypothetical protein